MQPKQSHLERRFANIWMEIAPELPLAREVSGIVPGRRYRYDFAYHPAKVLFEVNGGTYAKGRSGHSSHAGISRDADKTNRGQMAEYTVFLLTTDQLNREYISELIQFCLNKQATL